MSRTEHDIHILSVRCRIAVTRDDTGEIVGLQALQAEDRRKRLIEAAARNIANAAKPNDELSLNALAFSELWRELQAIRAGRT